MPDHIAPAVFVEETSFLPKAIEGVPTSTTGFTGLTLTGPVWCPGGPGNCAPRLVTSFAQYERIYGGLQPILTEPGVVHPNYMAFAARAFFENGGTRLYVSRVFVEKRATGVTTLTDQKTWGYATRAVAVPGFPRARWRARWPGTFGNVKVTVTAGPGPNLELRVTVTANDNRVEVYDHLSLSPAHERYLGKVLSKDTPADDAAVVCIEIDPAAFTAHPGYSAALAAALVGNRKPRLSGGHNGGLYDASQLAGREADIHRAQAQATGLAALGSADDIAIVAAPDSAAIGDVDAKAAAVKAVIGHAEKYRYRFAVVDAPPGSSLGEVRRFRGRFDSTRAALYYPWVEVIDPLKPVEHPGPGGPSQGRPHDRLLLPPCGVVAGIYAQFDTERGVHQGPANEVIRGIIGLETNVSSADLAVLNPEGVNVLRSVEGRGHRVWGARTMSSDPEWKYVNVRRLFVFLEHSIDRGTRWAVFEPNDDRLWANVRRTVESFLFALWREGALLGNRAEEAFFVRCDRTTMTQNDIDSGRMICLIGVAPLKPAEFVIFRIGQWTADARA